MIRVAIFSAGLAACSENPPALTLHVLDTDSLLVSLYRDAGHEFGTVTATANGVDLGVPELVPGTDNGWDEVAYPAEARFRTTLLSLGPDITVDVVEDGMHFIATAPTLGAPRQIEASMPMPLHPGDTVQVTSGVPSDSLVGCGIRFVVSGQGCLGASRQQLAGTVAYQVDPLSAWSCLPAPAAGTSVDATLWIDLGVTLDVSRCDGQDLSCRVDYEHRLHTEIPITLEL